MRGLPHIATPPLVALIDVVVRLPGTSSIRNSSAVRLRPSSTTTCAEYSVRAPGSTLSAAPVVFQLNTPLVALSVAAFGASVGPGCANVPVPGPFASAGSASRNVRRSPSGSAAGSVTLHTLLVLQRTTGGRPVTGE